MIHSASIKPLAINDLLTGAELSQQDLTMLLATAAAVKHNPRQYHGAFAGKALAMLFEKPSLRTRMTFEIGFARLGGHPAYVDQQSAHIGQRESLKDSVLNLERWVDVIVARTYSHQTIQDIASYVSVPVINALSDRFHPCQALADVLTIAERFPDRTWSDLALAYVGDGNNVCHSLLIAGAILGMKVTAVTPDGYEPAADILAQARELASQSGALIVLSAAPDAVAGHDAVYTDTWVSMGAEAEKQQRLKAFAPYQVTAKLMKAAGSGAIFMHCLPAYRGCEVSADVIDGPRSVVYDQAENRMHAQNALLLHLLAAEQHAGADADAPWPDAIGAM